MKMQVDNWSELNISDLKKDKSKLVGGNFNCYISEALLGRSNLAAVNMNAD